MRFPSALAAATVLLLAKQSIAFAPNKPRLLADQKNVKEWAPLQATPAESTDGEATVGRRFAFAALASSASAAAAAAITAAPAFAKSDAAAGSGAYDKSKSAPEFVQQYADFIETPEGWRYKDVKVGSGDVSIETGDRVVFDWSGYTIGYFGRPFEAKGGPQGGAFDKDLDFSRTVIGSGTVVPAVEEALKTMKPGGIRQVVVPYGALSYPPDDLEHNKVGPKPTTFSGQRALNFVLENPRVDRTLLFNVKVVRVDKKDPRGGFVRGG